MPREGHVAEVFRAFTYLRKYHNTELVFDQSNPAIDELDFEQRGWTLSEFGYIQGRENAPSNMPESRGKGVVTRAKVDVDRTSYTITRRSRTGL
eukprot:3023302-Ditylum_brightwellii.AAC.1